MVVLEALHAGVLWKTEIVFILMLKMPVSEFAGEIWVLTEAEAPESRKIPTLNPQHLKNPLDFNRI